MQTGKKIIEIIKPYCERIEYNGKHYKAFPPGFKIGIVFSATGSDRYVAKQVFRDFRRKGIIINKLNTNL